MFCIPLTANDLWPVFYPNVCIRNIDLTFLAPFSMNSFDNIDGLLFAVLLNIRPSFI